MSNGGTMRLDDIDFERGGGLVPVVAQHALTGEVLMVAWSSRESLQRTLDDGVMWYWSRSRGALWKKGETSGNEQRVVSLHHDCDGDTILARVIPHGPSCHTGAWSCFGAPPTLAALDHTLAERVHSGNGYTGKLLGNANLRLKKLGEEAVELALACERSDAEGAAGEAADLVYHALVACRAAGVDLAAVLRVLEERRSG